MTYFKNCKTAEEGKKLYRDLLKKYHPDNGGDVEKVKEINLEFENWWNYHKNIHDSSADTEVEKENDFTKEIPQDFIEIITKLSIINNIEIEICGTWLWIGGCTFPVKDYLRECGCKWAKGKKKWFWIPYELERYKRGKYTMNQIRNRYSSSKVKADTPKMISNPC